MSVLATVMRRKLRFGNLTVRHQDGTSDTFGDGTGAPVVVSATDEAARTIAIFPGLYLGEAYMDGGLQFETGTVWDLMDIIGRNFGGKRLGPQGKVADTMRQLQLRLQQ